MVSAILSAQQSALVCSSLYKRSVADVGEISLDLHRPGDKHPRYTVYVVDQPRIRGAKTYAAFIVPQGKYVRHFSNVNLSTVNYKYIILTHSFCIFTEKWTGCSVPRKDDSKF